ncbi:MAG: AAA family ATPase [Patescibacteria group bacterium]
MLTRIRVRNFKLFDEADIELGRPVVLIGPNNSGKTTALQAMALWDFGLRTWNAKRGGKASPEKRPGVNINRRDLTQIPIPSAILLWRGTDVRKGRRVGGEQKTENIRIDIIVDGITNEVPWSCALEFDYSNEESLICRPLRLKGFEHQPVPQSKFSEIPEAALSVKVAFLPPMSGLAATEPKWELGRINVLLGEGQTAQVIRNLCHYIYELTPDHAAWDELTGQIKSLFGVQLMAPRYIPERGEITMEYKDRDGTRLDLSSSGRGLLQTLLLLAHLYANPKTVLLLDEPDAHLEILRQRQSFRLIADLADQQGSQIIAASHSEVVMAEAAGRGKVIAFVGRPHPMNDQGGQLIKALTDVGWDQYYQAELAGWVLYLEGPTDWAILEAFARTLNHPAQKFLERPFVHYVATNLPTRARDHFYGLREAKPDLVGVALFDRLEKPLNAGPPLWEYMWERREIENYFCREDVLVEYARHGQPDDLFGIAEGDRREESMRAAIEEVSSALLTLGKSDPWSGEIKATDDFLDPVFKAFFKKLGLPLVFRKADYHQLAGLVPRAAIPGEVSAKLDAIAAVAKDARPRG